MKITATLTLILWTVFSFSMGYIWYDQVDAYFGGVRGGERTGFQVREGDNITIGTSSPNLADIHIYRTDATSTMAVTGNKYACLVLLDTNGSYQYYISNNQEWATTTAADCGF